MKRFVLCLSLMAAGCGFHTFRNSASTPTMETRTTSRVGWFSSRSRMSMKPTNSSYQVCMHEQTGNPSAVRLCECRQWGINQGMFPGAMYGGVGYPSGSYGYQTYCSPYR